MNYFKTIIEEEAKKEYYVKLHDFVIGEYETKTVFPERKNIYAALSNTPYDKVKVVILRTGSISRRRRGTWVIVFSKAGRYNTAIA